MIYTYADISCCMRHTNSRAR